MFDSPLAEVVRDGRINRILEDIRQAVRFGQPITIPPKNVNFIQRRFARALELGQKKLYDLARLILREFAGKSDVRLTWIVVGRCNNEAHTENVEEQVVDFTQRPDELISRSDSDLSIEHAPRCRLCDRMAAPIASYTRFEPLPLGEGRLVLLQTRIKTTSNIAYKIADMVFDIDHLFRRDKIYNEFSQVVTDVYGIKVVVRSEADLEAVRELLRKPSTGEVAEEKDYTGANCKLSGFEAYKVVVRKNKQLFEVQIQTKAMHDREISGQYANHRTYKELLMADRRKLGKEYLQVFQALARLLTRPNQNFCEIDPLALGQSGKGLDDEF